MISEEYVSTFNRIQCNMFSIEIMQTCICFIQMLPLIPWFDILTVIIVLGMVVTGNWAGTGTGWEDLDRLKDSHILRSTSSTTTTTSIPYVEFEDPKELNEWIPGKTYISANIDVRRLPNDFGIIITKLREICLSQNNWILASEFNPYQIISDSVNLTEGIEQSLKHYHYTPIEGAYEPEPTKSGSPSTVAPTEITDKANGEKMNSLRRIMNEINAKYMRMQPLLRIMAAGVKTVVPYVASAVLEKYDFSEMKRLLKSFLMVTAKKTLQIQPSNEYDPWRVRTELKEIDENLINVHPIPYPAIKSDELSETLSQTASILKKQDLNAKILEEIISSFIQNKVHPEFYESNSKVMKGLEEIHAENKIDGTDMLVDSVEKNMDDIFTKPLTTVVRNSDNKLDKYDVYTILPMTKKQNIYTIFEINTVPIADFETRTEYRQYQPTLTKILVGFDGQNFEYQESDFKCLPNTVDDVCDTCFIQQTPRLISDKCTNAIIQNDNEEIKANCPYVIEPEMQEVTIRLTDNQWAYSVNRPSEVKTICLSNNLTTVMKLPYAGIITMPKVADCSYEFKNGPFSNFRPSLPGIQMNITQYKMKAKAILNKIEEITTHLKENSTVYIILLLLTIITIVTFIITYFCCFKCFEKTRGIIRWCRKKKLKRRKTRTVTRRHKKVSLELMEIPTLPVPTNATSNRELHLNDMQTMWAVVPRRR
jgi:hypothetical protein